jgi:cytochrome c-type biogenesis protein CcmH/NrfF
VQIHQSEAAEKVRAEVVAYIERGDDEAKILGLLAHEYGERILGEPRGARETVAYVTPFVVLGLGMVWLGSYLFRTARPRPSLSTPSLSTYTGVFPDAGILPELPEVD